MVQISVGSGRRRIIRESFATGFGSAAAAVADISFGFKCQGGNYLKIAY